MSEKNTNNKNNRDLREELKHSAGSDLERRSMTFGHKKDIRNATIKYDRPSKPDDTRFQIDDDEPS